MFEQLATLARSGAVVIARDRWLWWDLFLALAPLALAYLLFWRSAKRGLLWWLGGLAFLALLPNAAYVLTDVFPMLFELRVRNYSRLVVLLVLIPQYLLYFLAGFQSYVISILLAARYLRVHGYRGRAIWLEAPLHALSAIGVYLGEVFRLNSWDVVLHPGAVLLRASQALGSTRAAAEMGVAFVVIAALFTLTKVVDLALLTYFQRPRGPVLSGPRMTEAVTDMGRPLNVEERDPLTPL